MSRLVAVKNEPKCAVCKSGKREVIESWWARRGEKDAGELVTTDYICERVIPILLDGQKPSSTSVKRHVRLHCRVVDEGDAAAGDEAGGFNPDAETERVLAEIDGLLESANPSPVGALSITLRAWLVDTRARLSRGEKLNITQDQAMRAAERLIAAEKQLGEADLLRSLTAGIGNAFAGSILGPEIAGELEVGDVIDVEAVEVEE